MPRPFCSAEFATLGSNPVPKHVRVIRTSFSHELLVMKFRDRDLSAANYKTGMPLAVQWGVHPKYREEFIGYVHHVVPSVENRSWDPPEIEVVAVGPTSAIRNEMPRNWGATRSDLVVEQIARDHRLGASVDRSPIVRPSLMQPAKSGWSFLIDLAKEDGYFLSATGTVVNLWDLETRLRALKDYAPVFHRSGVAKFEPLTGETNPTGNEATEMTAYALGGGGVAGFSENARSGTKALSDFLKPTAQYGSVVTGPLDSALDARKHVEAAKRRTSRIYQATTRLPAFPPLRPGDPVVFEGYGARQSGMWVTDSVEFTLTSESISSQAEVSRSISTDDGRRPRFPGARAPQRRTSQYALVRGVWTDRGGRG